MHIGDFEAAVREADPERERDTFTLNGETFTVADNVNIVALGRFARAARAGANTDDMEGLAALTDTVASLVIPEDENRFLDHASKHRVDEQLLFEIVGKVLEVQSGHPTEPPSDSSAGSSNASQSSRVPSSSAVSLDPPKEPSWRDTPFGRRELDPETGHPELYEDLGTVAEIGARITRQTG